ncbi:MAG TPA: FAD-dependent oxidoreductase, partial [bacterium]|nr:FAD-dependent oxidoreductase [bacterium]
MERKVLIAGAGPAGLTAGIYGRRAKLETIIVEQSFPGGTITLADKIENYPGFPRGVSGQELAALMEQQYRNLGGQILNGEISQVVPGKQQHTLIL